MSARREAFPACARAAGAAKSGMGKPLSGMSRAELIERVRALEAAAANSGRARAELFDTEERIRAILHTAVEGIITIDERGIIETVNPAVEKTFGYRADELVGENVSILMPAPYREQHDAYMQNYLRTGRAKIIGIGREVVGRRKDGAIFPMELSVGEVRLAGARMFTGIVRDITERKRLEKEVLEVSELERQRIGQDLHDDLGQRLTAIELLAEFLAQDLASKALPEAAQAEKIALRVREAIAQTRSLARGLAPVELRPDGLVSALHQLAAQVGDNSRVDCRFECKGVVRVKGSGVATHLYRIAQEAVHNAIRHGRARRVSVALAESGGAISLTVLDDGIGLPAERRGGGGRTEKLTGMGLRIMGYRAGTIGATLDIRPAAGRGTVVTCIVPQHL